MGIDSTKNSLVSTMIRIRKEQKEMIESSPMNLSKFVRIKLDEEFLKKDDVVVNTNEIIG